MQATLVVVSGKADKRQLSVKLPTILGRSRQADLTIAHSLISRKHCALLEREGVVILRDLGSLNGTYIRGEKVTGDVRLFPNDEFSIGPLTFQVQYDYPREKAPSPTAFAPGGTVFDTPGRLADSDQPRRAARSAETDRNPAADLAASASAGASGDSSGLSSSRVRLIDQARIPLPYSPSNSPDVGPVKLPIELNETLAGSLPKPAAAEPQSTEEGRATVPLSIAPEDGQLPDFSRWGLAEDGPGANRLPKPDQPPIAGDPPGPADPEPELKAPTGKQPKQPDSGDSEQDLRDFLNRLR